nr:MAG TPA: hypothetical protein [Caudoviricetes sp.]
MGRCGSIATAMICPASRGPSMVVLSNGIAG